METRFRFTPPSESELAFYTRWKWTPVSIACVWFCLSFYDAVSLGYKQFWVVLAVATIGLWLGWRLNDIRRRQDQASFGFVELTEQELRVSVSSRSLFRVDWLDFRGVDVKNGWLRFRFFTARLENAPQNGRLDRLRLRELEQPDALLEALRVQTGAS